MDPYSAIPGQLTPFWHFQATTSVFGLGIFLYSTRLVVCQKILARGRFVYNIDLVRRLCQDISDEKDPHRLADLASLLQAVIKEDQEEIRLRIGFLAKVYPRFAEYEASNNLSQSNQAKTLGESLP